MVESNALLVVGHINSLSTKINSIVHRYLPEDDIDYNDSQWCIDLIESFTMSEPLEFFNELQPKLLKKYDLNESNFNIIVDFESNVFGVYTSVAIDISDHKDFIKAMKAVYQNLFQEKDDTLQLFPYIEQY